MPKLSRRFGAAVVLLLVGILLSATLDTGDMPQEVVSSYEQAYSPIEFSASLGRGTLSLAGTTISDDHEVALAALAKEHFGEEHLLTDFRPGVALPHQWQAQTNRLLYAVAATESANAVLSTTSLRLTGVTSSPESLQQRLTFLAEALPADMALTADVATVDSDGSLPSLCRLAFEGLDASGIGFEESSDTLKTSSRPMLDRLSEFAFDCPEAVLVITGHSDASGNAEANILLSRQRAQAVADYLTTNGIPNTQLEVVGRGGAVPIADNRTIIGREQNRRIEIALK